MTFFELATWMDKLEQTPSRLEMTETLASIFHAASHEEIGRICYLLLGRVAPKYEPIEFGVATKFMIRAIAAAYGVEQEAVQEAFKAHGDLGDAASVVYKQRERSGTSVDVVTVFDTLLTIAHMSGSGSQEQKIDALADVLSRVDKQSARYIVRIPLDKLRLGFSDMTILDALSWMEAGDKSLRPVIEVAYNARPDIGYIAQTVKKDGVEGLAKTHVRANVPVLAALCQRLSGADEMIRKMGTVSVEPKYDGVRVQIHYQIPNHKSQFPIVQSYSRNLENTTGMFPELQEIGEQLNATSVILDSEAIGIDPKTGEHISFQQTMTRKRKHGIAEARDKVPLKFFVFDILLKDGKDLLQTPLSERRAILEQTIKKGPILQIAPHIVTESPDEIRTYHEKQLHNGLEGAVIKKWDGPYEPGRRGYSWVKFKEEEGKTGQLADTIDAVVMGYYRGEGKRSSFGIGAFLVGVRNEDTVVTITKIGTGVSDKQWEELYTLFEKQRAGHQPKQYSDVNKIFTPDVWLEPTIVVELAGDSLTKSPTHGAGYAVRFPRLIRVRDDKSVEQATTVKEIEQMYGNQ